MPDSPPALFSPAHLARYVEEVGPPALAAPPPTGMSPWARALLYGGQLADGTSTVALASQGRFREANPIGAPGVLALKAAILLAMPHLTRHMSRPMANTTGALVGLGGAVPAAWNVHLAARAR